MTTDAPVERKFPISKPNLDLLARHAINLRDGRLIPSGSLQTTEQTVRDLFQKMLPDAYNNRAKGKPFQILFFAHGGTVTEEDAVRQALAHIPHWLEAGIYPIFFIWETDVWHSIRDCLLGRPKDRGLGDILGKIQQSFVSSTDWTIEKAVRAGGIDDVWNQMKLYAQRGVEPGRGGADLVATELAGFMKSTGIDADQVKVHCLGHSAGAVFHAWFIPALIAAKVGGVASLSLLAPAITTALFEEKLLPLVGSDDGVAKLTMFTMDEKTELADNVIRIYRKSLLYLISRALEPKIPTAILGMEESIRANRNIANLFNYPLGDGGDAELIFSPTGAAKAGRASNSRAHGGFGNEPDTLNSIVFRLTGKDAKPFPADFKETVGQTPTDRAMPAPSLAPAASRRLALCIGIDDYPAAPLAGCVNDALLWQETFAALGFESAGLLVNEQATYAGILAAIEELVTTARPGDALVIQYAGHGTQLDDLDGDETDDQLDEALVPFDYTSGKFVLDDDLGRIFSQLPDGVGLTCFVDSCHSGTINRAFGPTALRAASGERERFIVVDAKTAAKHKEFRESEPTACGAAADDMREIAFAACQPEQTAKEKDGHGYFTVAATTLIRSGVAVTNAGLLKLLIDHFPLKPASQLPHLNCQNEFLELPLFQIAAAPARAPGSPAAVPVAARSAAPAACDARLLMETMNRYLTILDRLTGGKC